MGPSPLGWQRPRQLLHFLFAVFRNEPLLLVSALLAVLIRSEAESVSFQMGLGERGSQRDPMSQPLHTHMSIKGSWDTSSDGSVGLLSKPRRGIALAISHRSREDTAA